MKSKSLQRFLRNPQNAKYEEIEWILINAGFTKIQAKGSHRKFKHEDSNRDLIIPVHNNDCKPFYKHLAAKIIKSL